VGGGIAGLCKLHGGGKRCSEVGCDKSAQGATTKCITHGGGKRCTEVGCTKGAEGGTAKCVAHGGGKRCTAVDCTNAARGGTVFCIAHGGGPRCLYKGPELEGDCTKAAQGGTMFCIAHGGGKCCEYAGCGEQARGGTCSACHEHAGDLACNSQCPFEHKGLLAIQLARTKAQAKAEGAKRAAEAGPQGKAPQPKKCKPKRADPQFGGPRLAPITPVPRATNSLQSSFLSLAEHEGRRD
jgi:hypothetical protein